ncbi:hypothetical protein RYX36_000347 [Vicia faba]
MQDVDSEIVVHLKRLGRKDSTTKITFCATIVETRILVASPFGWCYRVCHLCPCIARGDTLPFNCDAGHSTEVRIDDPLEFPLALDHLLNLEMAFKVKWKPRWNDCSVVRILRDDPFIMKLKAPWA